MRSLLANRWLPGWLAAWSAAALVWMAQAGAGVCDPLEEAWGRQTRASVAVQPVADLVIVAIDDASLQAIGAWPWPRETHARLIDRLTAAGARRIIHTAPFVGAESRQALSQLERIASAVTADPHLPEHERLLGLVQQSQILLDGDGQLAQSIAQSQRTVLAVRQGPGRTAEWPLAQLAAGALGTGHAVFEPSASGLVRTHTLQWRSIDRPIPSLALWAAEGRPLPATADLQPFWRPAAERRDIPQFSAAAIINGTLAAPGMAQLAGKTVFVGAVTSAVTPSLPFLDAGALYPVQALAQAGAAVSSGQWVSRPDRLVWVQWAVAALVLGYLAWLPRLAGPAGLAVTALLAILLLAGSQLAMSSGGIEMPVMPAVVALVIGHAAARWAGRRWPGPQQTAGMAPPPALADTPDSAPRAGQTIFSLEPSAPSNAADATEPMPLRPTPPTSNAHTESPPPPRLVDTQPMPAPAPRVSPPAAPPVAPLASATGPTSGLVPLALADLPPLLKQPSATSSMVRAAATASRPPLPTPDPAAPPEPARPARLPRLGRFQLLRELGRGAMGRVYLGEETTTHETVAVKTLALSREFEGFALREARQRFQREALAALRLRHPGIVRLVDAGEDQGYAWIAMELLHGHDLVRYTQRSQLLAVPEVLAICACVAEALAHAHAQGVIHRDIKPANVMYEPRNGDVKVTDFGIARITDAARTRTGLLFGSPSYMSPEHLAGGQVDGRSDIYSLGVLLFELLTGSLPLSGRSMAELMQAVAQTPAPDVRSRRPRLPEPVANIVALALEKRPELRYASAAEMAADLRAVRELWQAAPPPPTTFGSLADVPIQGSVHDVAAGGGLAAAPAAEPVGLVHNLSG